MSFLAPIAAASFFRERKSGGKKIERKAGGIFKEIPIFLLQKKIKNKSKKIK